MSATSVSFSAGTKNTSLGDADGNKRPVGCISGRKRSWGERQVWDARRRQWFQAGVVAIPVTHPDYDQPLTLVVCRPGKGRPPWYLLTTEEISSEEDAWAIVFAYARRWQIEMEWRYNKSELAMESPRLRKWETRLKLLVLSLNVCPPSELEPRPLSNNSGQKSDLNCCSNA